jgi:hypothetical protein
VECPIRRGGGSAVRKTSGTDVSVITAPAEKRTMFVGGHIRRQDRAAALVQDLILYINHDSIIGKTRTAKVQTLPIRQHGYVQNREAGRHLHRAGAARLHWGLRTQRRCLGFAVCSGYGLPGTGGSDVYPTWRQSVHQPATYGCDAGGAAAPRAGGVEVRLASAVVLNDRVELCLAADSHSKWNRLNPKIHGAMAGPAAHDTSRLVDVVSACVHRYQNAVGAALRALLHGGGGGSRTITPHGKHTSY